MVSNFSKRSENCLKHSEFVGNFLEYSEFFFELFFDLQEDIKVFGVFWNFLRFSRTFQLFFQFLESSGVFWTFLNFLEFSKMF